MAILPGYYEKKPNKKLVMLRNAVSKLKRMAMSESREEAILMNQGRILSRMNESVISDSLSEYEFKIFSQFGEDGIIQHLIKSLVIENQTFIEFGVESFHESNCRFLLIKDLWAGFVIDGSAENLERMRNSTFYWQFQLEGAEAFIDKDSIRPLLESSGFGKSPGILSVDIDGVDYHVLEQLSDYRPSILIVEYNSLFGSEQTVSVPYQSDFVRSEAHWSNQYWGASLPAFNELAKRMEMALVGVTSTGQNAFFVRRDLLNDKVKEVTIDKCFRSMSFRDSRDTNGNLTFNKPEASLELIADLPLVNTETGQVAPVAELVG